ncbi:hypothetical protein BC829DRAFT_385604 [Chytridium lagenaria]|nr:hypothetical protein BC829DRAFT_385604 [Chytridium lagenaria]
MSVTTLSLMHKHSRRRPPPSSVFFMLNPHIGVGCACGRHHGVKSGVGGFEEQLERVEKERIESRNVSPLPVLARDLSRSQVALEVEGLEGRYRSKSIDPEMGTRRGDDLRGKLKEGSGSMGSVKLSKGDEVWESQLKKEEVDAKVLKNDEVDNSVIPLKRGLEVRGNRDPSKRDVEGHVKHYRRDFENPPISTTKRDIEFHPKNRHIAKLLARQDAHPVAKPAPQEDGPKVHFTQPGPTKFLPLRTYDMTERTILAAPNGTFMSPSSSSWSMGRGRDESESESEGRRDEDGGKEWKEGVSAGSSRRNVESESDGSESGGSEGRGMRKGKRKERRRRGDRREERREDWVRKEEREEEVRGGQLLRARLDGLGEVGFSGEELLLVGRRAVITPVPYHELHAIMKKRHKGQSKKERDVGGESGVDEEDGEEEVARDTEAQPEKMELFIY